MSSLSCSTINSFNQIVCSYSSNQTVAINVSNSVPVNSISTIYITTLANVYTSTTDSYSTSVTQTILNYDDYSYSYYFISPNVFAIPCTTNNGQIYDCFNPNTSTQTITLTSELVQPLSRNASYKIPNLNCNINPLASCSQSNNTVSIQYCNGVGSFCNQSNSSSVICNGVFASCNQSNSNGATCNGNYAYCNQSNSNFATCNGNNTFCNQTEIIYQAECNGTFGSCTQSSTGSDNGFLQCNGYEGSCNQLNAETAECNGVLASCFQSGVGIKECYSSSSECVQLN